MARVVSVQGSSAAQAGIIDPGDTGRGANHVYLFRLFVVDFADGADEHGEAVRTQHLLAQRSSGRRNNDGVWTPYANRCLIVLLSLASKEDAAYSGPGIRDVGIASPGCAEKISESETRI